MLSMGPTITYLIDGWEGLVGQKLEKESYKLGLHIENKNCASFVTFFYLSTINNSTTSH